MVREDSKRSFGRAGEEREEDCCWSGLPAWLGERHRREQETYIGKQTNTGEQTMLRIIITLALIAVTLSFRPVSGQKQDTRSIRTVAYRAYDVAPSQGRAQFVEMVR